MTKTTAEDELRKMIGDLFMQMAMARADAINAQQPTKPNGLDRQEERDADHRPEPS